MIRAARTAGRALHGRALVVGVPALLLAGALTAAFARTGLDRRGPIAVSGAHGIAQLRLDTTPPERPVRLLWFRGRAASPTAAGVVTVDDGGAVVAVDERLRPSRPRIASEGREIASVASAPDGGLWLTDAGGALLLARTSGSLRLAAPSPFAFGAVASSPDGRHAWLVRSAARFAYRWDSAAALFGEIDPAGLTLRPVGRAWQPAHVLLTDLANAGHLAVDGDTVFYAPFIRDEVLALGAAGDTLWVARRGLAQHTVEPRFEVRQGRAIVDYHPVNLGIAVGPDHRIYVLSTRDADPMTARLDVFTRAGQLIRTASLPAPFPTLAVDDEGRVYWLDAVRLLTGIAPAAREPLPGFDLPLLSRGRVTSAALRGRVTLINVWASWCAPCRVEMPALDSLARGLPDPRFQFLTVNEDLRPADARRFLDGQGLDLPVLLGGGRMRGAFHYMGLPYSVVTDARGRILAQWSGYAGPEQIEAIRGAVRAELARMEGGLAMPMR